jgi:dTDP-4-amino-4,6-dideoxygalactose transaminase
MPRPIPFYLHDLGQAELEAVAEVLRGPILTTGDAVKAFEARFAALLGRRRAVGLSSATGALHLMLTALGIGPGDEVITTPLSFIATATAIVQAGAIPVFVDVEEDTGNLDASLIEAAITPRTRAIIPVHLYGHMVDMAAIRTIAERHALPVIEDAAHCVEGMRDGLCPGEASAGACFSFYATKNLNCGEGGAIATDHAELADRIAIMSVHGMNKTAADRQRHGYSHWDMEVFGWKYNMSNIQAALLLPQFDRLEKKSAERQHLATRYGECLDGLSGITRQAVRPGCSHAWHLFVIRSQTLARDALVERLGDAKIGVAVNYRPIHLMRWFRDKWGYGPGDFPIAERWGSEVLSLPFYPGMGDEAVATVADCIRSVVGKGG